jgi:hypothetical protein
MARKPVLGVAGAVLTGLALAGCQNNSASKTPTAFQGGSVAQNQSTVRNGTQVTTTVPPGGMPGSGSFQPGGGVNVGASGIPNPTPVGASGSQPNFSNLNSNSVVGSSTPGFSNPGVVNNPANFSNSTGGLYKPANSSPGSAPGGPGAASFQPAPSNYPPNMTPGQFTSSPTTPVPNFAPAATGSGSPAMRQPTAPDVRDPFKAQAPSNPSFASPAPGTDSSSAPLVRQTTPFPSDASAVVPPTPSPTTNNPPTPPSVPVMEVPGSPIQLQKLGQ